MQAVATLMAMGSLLSAAALLALKLRAAPDAPRGAQPRGG
jgi:hypothetical protein